MDTKEERQTDRQTDRQLVSILTDRKAAWKTDRQNRIDNIG